MTRTAQLSLVQPLTRNAATQAKTSADPTRRVFEHWVFMFARNPARCKMGPTRKTAINAALALYDEEQVLLCIEGMAADPLDGCTEQMARAMRELEWLLAKEARIERWAEMGDALRERASDVAMAAEAAPPQVDQPPDELELARIAAERERLRTLAARMRGART